MNAEGRGSEENAKRQMITLQISVIRFYPCSSVAILLSDPRSSAFIRG